MAISFRDRLSNAIHRKQTAEIRPFFNVVAETEEDPAEVTLFGDVVESTPTDWWTGQPIDGMYIALDQVLAELDAIKDASNITIHLNSSGGDLFAGIAIHNLLRSFPGNKTVIVEGLAASAASAIMCAGDTIKLHPSSMVMIHNVASCLCGWYSTGEIRDLLRDHEACELSLKRLYADRTGKSEDELQCLLDATTWMIGQDAIDQGFADELIETESDDPIEPTITNDGQFMMVAGVRHAISNLGSIPSFIAGGQIDVSVKADTKENGDQVAREEDAVDIQNAADLSREYPEFVNELIQDAVNAERERIHAIEDIAASIGNAELVNKAKFDEPVNAAQLALDALKADKQARAQFLNEMEEDEEESCVDEVEPTPAEEEEDEKTEEEQANALMSNMAALFNSVNKGVK